MKKTNRFILIYLTLIVLNGCTSMQEGFSSNKKKGSDEFLVEKKAPLVMPPNYEELPVPNQENQETEEKSENIKKLISKDDNEILNNSTSSENNNSLEKNILDKIKN